MWLKAAASKALSDQRHAVTVCRIMCRLGKLPQLLVTDITFFAGALIMLGCCQGHAPPAHCLLNLTHLAQMMQVQPLLQM